MRFPILAPGAMQVESDSTPPSFVLTDGGDKLDLGALSDKELHAFAKENGVAERPQGVFTQPRLIEVVRTPRSGGLVSAIMRSPQL